MLTEKELEEHARKIRLLCTDVDGVLTTGALHYYNDITHGKSFNAKDGAGIKWLQNSGIPVAFVSGLYSVATMHRALDLQVTDCIVGKSNKKEIFEQLCDKHRVNFSEVAYIGDDLIDIPVLKNVGLALCPQDAATEVKLISHWTVPVLGGMGVVRAVAEMLLKHQGYWQHILESFS